MADRATLEVIREALGENVPWDPPEHPQAPA